MAQLKGTLTPAHTVRGEMSIGGGGTNNYPDLENLPQINGVELVGNKSLDDLGIDIPTKTSDLDNDSGYVNSSIVANPYDSTTTYAVGAYVTHDNNLYKCNTAIATAEEWNAEHWTLVDVISAIPTKTSQLQNDSGFITGDDYYDKSSSNNKFATQFDNIIGNAGNFNPSNSWFLVTGASDYSVSNNVASFTASAQYGGIKTAQSFNVFNGHQYYAFAKIKANNKICLSYDGGGGVAFSTGSGEWEFISSVFTSNQTVTRTLTVTDNNPSGFGAVEVKEVGVIDLTLAFGNDIPFKAVLDANISPMGFISLSTAGKLASELANDFENLDSRVTTLENNVDTRTYKLIALGDSITAFGTGSRGWLKYFKERINCDIIANVAVDGAWLNDKAAATVYDGNPQPGDNNLNVLGNQVQKILNNNYDTPDLILIAVGTNSGISITEQQIKEVYFNNGFVALDDVDRTTSAGAYRWCLEKLHTKYPDAIIIWFSPIHGAEPTMKSASSIAAWGESLRIATAITGQQYIESFRCGICGYKEVMNAEGEYLQDGLHPNAKGAKKLGYYNASQVKNILMQVFST